MCHLLIGTTKTPNNKEFKKVIQAQYDHMYTQPDGAAAFVITFDNKLHIFRSFFDYDGVFGSVDDIFEQAKVIGIHTRIGTCGSKGIGNVHFFEDNGYILAHNGTIPKLSSYSWRGGNSTINKTVTELYEDIEKCFLCKQDEDGVCVKHTREEDALLLLDSPDSADAETFEPCDSLKFLRQIAKPITPDNLKGFAVENTMNGMMVVIEKETNNVTLLIKKEVKSISDRKTFGVFFSFEPKVEVQRNNWSEVFGVPVMEPPTKTKLPYTAKKVSYGAFTLTI